MKYWIVIKYKHTNGATSAFGLGYTKAPIRNFRIIRMFSINLVSLLINKQ